METPPIVSAKEWDAAWHDSYDEAEPPSKAWTAQVARGIESFSKDDDS